MCTANIIQGIREDLLRIIPPERGCFDTNIPDARRAFSQGTYWDSWIYRKHDDKIKRNFIVVLQYLVRGADNALGVNLAGNRFSPVRLVIYDELPVPQVDNRVENKQGLYNNLQQATHFADTDNYRFQLPSRLDFGDSVGHVVVSTITAPGGDNAWWNMENRNDRNAFIIEVAAALNALVPVADYYVANRNDLFIRK